MFVAPKKIKILKNRFLATPLHVVKCTFYSRDHFRPVLSSKNSTIFIKKIIIIKTDQFKL